MEREGESDRRGKENKAPGLKRKKKNHGLLVDRGSLEREEGEGAGPKSPRDERWGYRDLIEVLRLKGGSWLTNVLA